MKSIELLHNKISSLCTTIYASENIKSRSIPFPSSMKEMMWFARRNRLDHFLSLELLKENVADPELNELLQELDLEYTRYKNTLKAAILILKDILPNQRWMMIKTISSYPHITTDIDVLVESAEIAKEARALVKKTGWGAGSREESTTDLLDLEIDINHKISWTSTDEVSPKFIWSNMEEIVFEGLTLHIPNPLLDTILRVAHMPFEMGEVRLGELMHIYHQAQTLDWKILEGEAIKMNWPRTFKNISTILSSIHQGLFHSHFHNLKKNNLETPIEFPYQIPYFTLASSVIEKRAWIKIWGARYILLDRFIGAKCSALPRAKHGV